MRNAIRLPPDFFTRQKINRLRKRTGDASAVCLRCLWLWAARNRPDGDLSGLDDTALETAAGWMGKRGAFIGALCDLGFMEGEAGAYRLRKVKLKPGR